MPSGKYIRTPEIKAKTAKGVSKYFSSLPIEKLEDYKEKLRKRPPVWNKGKVGCYSEDQLKKYSETHMGHKASEETKILMSQQRRGENHYNWKGGISYLPYSPMFNKQLKERIRERDSYICQNCSMSEEEHLIVYGQVLHVHHIDYNKENCSEKNLITSCNPCNVRFNYNRPYWQELLRSKNEQHSLR